jgi:hypothetical protein
MLHTSEDYLCTNLHISAPVSLNDSPAIPNPETVYTRFFSSHDTSMESVFNSTVFGLVSFELRGIQATEERKSAPDRRINQFAGAAPAHREADAWGMRTAARDAGPGRVQFKKVEFDWRVGLSKYASQIGIWLMPSDF